MLVWNSLSSNHRPLGTFSSCPLYLAWMPRIAPCQCRVCVSFFLVPS